MHLQDSNCRLERRGGERVRGCVHSVRLSRLRGAMEAAEATAAKGPEGADLVAY